MHTDYASAEHHSPVKAQRAVSWSAVLAGAVAAAALSLILLLLGTGLGFAAMSPWENQGLSAKAIGVSGIVWITFMSLASSGIGGYIAGRSRTRWVSVHNDEIYFRDTLHGFLAWALATLLTASLLASAVGAIVSSGAKAGAVVAATAATGAAAVAQSEGTAEDSVLGYTWDHLLRRKPGYEPPATSTANKQEIARIFANALRTQSLPAEDERYLVRVVAERTGIDEREARARIEQAHKALRDAEQAAKEAADKAAAASAYTSLWLFISLLIGAFIAALAATFGGRCRDRN